MTKSYILNVTAFPSPGSRNIMCAYSPNFRVVGIESSVGGILLPRSSYGPRASLHHVISYVRNYYKRFETNKPSAKNTKTNDAIWVRTSPWKIFYYVSPRSSCASRKWKTLVGLVCEISRVQISDILTACI